MENLQSIIIDKWTFPNSDIAPFKVEVKFEVSPSNEISIVSLSSKSQIYSSKIPLLQQPHNFYIVNLPGFVTSRALQIFTGAIPVFGVFSYLEVKRSMLSFLRDKSQMGIKKVVLDIRKAGDDDLTEVISVIRDVLRGPVKHQDQYSKIEFEHTGNIIVFAELNSAQSKISNTPKLHSNQKLTNTLKNLELKKYLKNKNSIPFKFSKSLEDRFIKLDSLDFLFYDNMQDITTLPWWDNSMMK